MNWTATKMKQLTALIAIWCGFGVLHPIPSVSGETGFYPIGAYGVSSVEDLHFAKRIGLNTVRCGAGKELLDAAKELDLKVLATPGTTAGEGFSREKALRTVIRFDHHQALWAWYLVDEPSLNRVSPRHVKEAYDWMKYAGAEKPISIVMYRSGRADRYADSTDILLVDRYPIPWMPVANFAKHINNGRLVVGNEKPLIPIIQSFNWENAGAVFDLDIPLRPPRYDELRCMTYCSLVKGANGLFFYALKQGDWDIRNDPGPLASLKAVLQEVRERLPLFKGEHRWWPHYERFGGSENRFNEALNATIASALIHVERGNDTVRPGDYIVAVNTTKKAISYSVTVPKGSAPVIPVLGEERAVKTEEGWLKDRFGRYELRVYGPLNGTR